MNSTIIAVGFTLHEMQANSITSDPLPGPPMVAVPNLPDRNDAAAAENAMLVRSRRECGLCECELHVEGVGGSPLPAVEVRKLNLALGQIGSAANRERPDEGKPERIVRRV